MKKIRLLVIFTLLLSMIFSMIPHAFAAKAFEVGMVSFIIDDGLTITINDGEKSGYSTVPLFNQMDYPDVDYGSPEWSVASHGCGIVSVAMVASYLTDTYQSPADLAQRFGRYNTEHGSYWTLFADSAKALGLPFVCQTNSLNKVIEALQNGQVVVSLQSKGIFTGGGHFIVLTGMTQDGKIMVNDPNGYNWNKDKEMIEGFRNGFTIEQISNNGGTYWIYGEKGSEPYQG